MRQSVEKDQPDQGVPTRSVRLAVAALRLLNTAPSFALREISSGIGGSRSTTYRILAALVEEGLVKQDSVTGLYSIDFGVVAIATSLLESRSMVSVAKSKLSPVHQSTGETVGLHVRFNTFRVCVVEFESPHQLRMVSGVGNVYPLHAGAAGKAILAFSPTARSALDDVAFLEAGTPNTPVDLAQLDLELAKVRAQGYAASLGEITQGARAVAVPVLDHHGEAVAAGYVSGPATRLGESELDHARDLLIEACRDIARVADPALSTSAGVDDPSG